MTGEEPALSAERSKWKYFWFVTRLTMPLHIALFFLLYVDKLPVLSIDSLLFNPAAFVGSVLALPPMLPVVAAEDLFRWLDAEGIFDRKDSKRILDCIVPILFLIYFVLVNAVILKVFYTRPPYSIRHYAYTFPKMFAVRICVMALLLYLIVFGSVVMSY